MRRAPRGGRPAGRAAVAALASLGLHAAVLAALWPGAAPAPAPGSRLPALVVKLVPHAAPAAWPPAAVPALRAAPVERSLLERSPVERPPLRRPSAGPSTGRSPAAESPAAESPAAEPGATGTSTAAPLPARSPAGPALAFHEQWDLDEPPQFLHVPASLAEAIEAVGAGDAPVDAQVALFIDARGRPVRVDASGLIEPGVLARLSAALGDAWFAPGRLGGVPVASVKRFEWRARTLGARVIAAESAR